jgi:hypothetical protein
MHSGAFLLIIAGLGFAAGALVPPWVWSPRPPAASPVPPATRRCGPTRFRMRTRLVGRGSRCGALSQPGPGSRRRDGLPGVISRRTKDLRRSRRGSTFCTANKRTLRLAAPVIGDAAPSLRFRLTSRGSSCRGR